MFSPFLQCHILAQKAFGFGSCSAGICLPRASGEKMAQGRKEEKEELGTAPETPPHRH